MNFYLDYKKKSKLTSNNNQGFIWKTEGNLLSHIDLYSLLPWLYTNNPKYLEGKEKKLSWELEEAH